MIKWKEEKGVTVIAILFIIIAILGIVMAIKVLMPKQEQEMDENNIKTYNTLISEQQKEQKEKDKEEVKKYENKIKVINSFINLTNSAWWKIANLLISCIIAFGTGKLYEKLGMPKSAVIFTWAYPFINLILNYMPGVLKTVANIVVSVMSLSILYNYFKALDISPIWIIAPVVAYCLIAIGIFTGNMTLMILFGIVAVIVIIAFIGIWILTSIKLSEKFEKGKGFTVGLVLLPFIFKPMLGYQKEN